MRTHSRFGGREELGQNFLIHKKTIRTIADLARATSGSILEIGPGRGAVTAELHRLGRPLTIVEIDETRLNHLADSFPRAQVVHADALRHPLDASVIVGNLPFHLTTPILRKLLHARTWQQAVLLTQWEVARKRAGIGGSTMLTAQWAPWFDFRLIERVPAHAFSPKPSVDGGILTIERLERSLVPPRRRSDYQQFVRSVFTGRGRGMKGILKAMSFADSRTRSTTMNRHDISGDALPRDLAPDQWVGLYTELTVRARDTRPGASARPTASADERKTMTASNNPTQTNPPGKGTSEKASTPRPSTAAGESNRTAGRGEPSADTAFGSVAAGTEKPVITGELPIVRAADTAAKLSATLPNAEGIGRIHDKAHQQAERGFMPQHQKPTQPQQRWNLPRRQG